MYLELCATAESDNQNECVNSTKGLGGIGEDNSSQHSNKSFVFSISKNVNHRGNFNFCYIM